MQHNRAKQSSHTLYIEEANYSCHHIELLFQTLVKQWRFRLVIIDWHWILEFALAWEGSSAQPSARAEMTAQQEKKEIQRLSSWPRAMARA